MLGYFNDRVTARRHAKVGQRVVETRFSLSKMVADYASMYEHALATAGVPIPPSGDQPGPEALGPVQTRTFPN